MPIRFRTYQSNQEAEIELTGGLLGCSVNAQHDRRQVGIVGLQGLKIRFTAPAAATVTFSKAGAGPQTLFTFAEIKAAIEAVVAGLTVRTVNERFVFERTVGFGIVTVDSSSVLEAERANQLFGLPVTQSGVVFNGPDGVAPRWISVEMGVSGEYIHAVETTA